MQVTIVQNCVLRATPGRSGGESYGDKIIAEVPKGTLVRPTGARQDEFAEVDAERDGKKGKQTVRGWVNERHIA